MPARRRFSATWTVLACEPPALWVIATSPPQGDARIVYELRGDGDALTRFFRTLSYRSRRWPWTMFDAQPDALDAAKQSERALANLKHVLEGGKLRLRERHRCFRYAARVSKSSGEQACARGQLRTRAGKRKAADPT